MQNNRQKVTVSQSVYIPPGVIDLVNEKVSNTETLDPTPDASTAPEQIELPIPETFTIIKQDVHRNKDGTKVVDVTIETDDFAGIVQFDVRVTKA